MYLSRKLLIQKWLCVFVIRCGADLRQNTSQITRSISALDQAMPPRVKHAHGKARATPFIVSRARQTGPQRDNADQNDTGGLGMKKIIRNARRIPDCLRRQIAQRGTAIVRGYGKALVQPKTRAGKPPVAPELGSESGLLIQPRHGWASRL
jgi:hypothetical protein